MTQLDCLVAQATHHQRCWTEQTAGLDLRSVLYRAHPTGPSIAWLLGHVLHEVDTTIEAVLGVARTLPAEFDAGAADADWGVRSEADWKQLREHWLEAGPGLLKGLEKLPAEALEMPCAVELHRALRETLSTRLAWLQGHVFHLAYHLGQASLLRSAAARNSLTPPQA